MTLSMKIDESRQEGLEQGLEQGIRGMVSTLKELNIPDSVIVEKLCDKFELTEDKAKEYCMSHSNAI